MILIAVIVGYALGAFPFIFPKILDNNRVVKKEVEEAKEDKVSQEIFDEWLNGPKESNKINQEDIFQEYLTGKEVTKGD